MLLYDVLYYSTTGKLAKEGDHAIPWTAIDRPRRNQVALAICVNGDPNRRIWIDHTMTEIPAPAFVD